MRALITVGSGLVLAAGSPAPLPHLDDLAAKFGARPNAESIALSPSGDAVAVVTPVEGTRSTGVVLDVLSGTTTRIVGDEKSEFRLRECAWKSDRRLLCFISASFRDFGKLLGTGRTVVINSAGKQDRGGSWSSRTFVQIDSGIVDPLPDDPKHVLIPGAKVDIDTGVRTNSPPDRADAIEYISDDHGNVRILMIGSRGSSGILNHNARYLARAGNSGDWLPLATTTLGSDAAPRVLGMDEDGKRVLMLKPKDGRMALYKVALDGSGRDDLVAANDKVDIDGVLRIGKYSRPVAVAYTLDTPQYDFFDAKLEHLSQLLSKALPTHPTVTIYDESWDGKKLLVFAGADNDPGTFYRYDAATHHLQALFNVRPALAGITHATVHPVSYAAADGTQIPAFLTLPAGHDSARGLPALLMPHGGPSARDKRGFNWLAQFFAASGYAVLQPNFRGSAGYGQKWFAQNGFKGWRTAMGDINDGARWLIGQGTDKTKLAIFGWSYGGYAALQANVLEPGLYKAAIAVAPVTDLTLLRSESEGFINERIERDFIGTGPHLVEGSPARNAARIEVPVLIFQGEKDLNVDVAQAKRMDAALAHAGKSHQLVIYPGLDHQLDDGDARADMLRRSAAFLAAHLGAAPAPASSRAAAASMP